MRGTKVTLLVLGLALLPAAVAAIVLQQRSNSEAKLNAAVTHANATLVREIDSQTNNASQSALLVAHDAAFSLPEIFKTEGLAPERGWKAVDRSFAYLSRIYKGRIGAARFFTLSGRQMVEVIEGRVLDRSMIPVDVDRHSQLFAERYPYFKPALALGPNHVFEGAPFVSPEAQAWVIPFATVVEENGKPLGVFEFELTIDGLREAATAQADGFVVAVLDRTNSQVVLSANPLDPGATISRGADNQATDLPMAYDALQAAQKKPAGLGTWGGYRVSFQTINPTRDNANAFVLIAAKKDKKSAVALWIIVAALVVALLLGVSLALGRRFARTHDEALHDALTGLSNRRKLLLDLERSLAGATRADELVLALFDLDGFKGVNDTFGHTTGDELLARLGARLRDAVRAGEAYRMGGDEFCILAQCPAGGPEELIERACLALSEEGVGYRVGTSVGVAILPRDASEVIDALNVADKRLYGDKADRKRVTSDSR